MSKNIIFDLAVFAGGVAIGILAGKKIYEEKYKRYAEEEIESVKETLKKPWEPRPYRDFGISKTENTSETAIPKSITDRKPIVNSYEQAKIDYTKAHQRYYRDKDGTVREMPDDYTPDDEKEDDDLRDAAGMTEEDMIPNGEPSRDLSGIDRELPYVIDNLEYADEFPHHEKITLYYYRFDDVLCEENEEIIDDPDYACGFDAIAKLEMQTTSWARNEKISIDYEIVRIDGSYAELVQGIKPRAVSPREKYNSKPRKKPVKKPIKEEIEDESE